MQGFVSGLSFQTSKGVRFVCIVAEPQSEGGIWQVLAIRTGQGSLEGASGTGSSKDEALQNALKEAEKFFKPRV